MQGDKLYVKFLLWKFRKYASINQSRGLGKLGRQKMQKYYKWWSDFVLFIFISELVFFTT